MNDQVSIARQMPRYRSHKTVWALEIKSIERNPASEGGGWIVTPIDQGYAPITLPNDVFVRFMPNPGDFIVQYEDGYWSASPRKAFLEGYRPLHEQVEKALDGKLGTHAPHDIEQALERLKQTVKQFEDFVRNGTLPKS